MEEIFGQRSWASVVAVASSTGLSIRPTMPEIHAHPTVSISGLLQGPPVSAGATHLRTVDWTERSTRRVPKLRNRGTDREILLKILKERE